jgi:hypothetical protein
MAISFGTLATYALGGAFIATGYYLYKNGYLEPIWAPTPTPTDGNGGGGTVEPFPVPGAGLAYYVKRKAQCRDNHLISPYLQTQGIKVLNYKLYNDGSVRPQLCGAPSSLLILVAIDSEDFSSAGILESMGFIEYYAPISPETYMPIQTSQLAMVQVGSAPNHRAYRVYRNV